MKRDSSSHGFPSRMGERGRTISTRRTRRGFTLLEMCVVLIIIVMLFALAMPAISTAFTEQAVRKDSHQLALMVKTAMLRSVEQHRTYVIDLSEKTMALHPLGTVALDADADPDDAAPPANGPVDISVTTNLDAPNKLMVPDPKKADTWMPMPADTEWSFAPGGLCQVGKVRIARGDAYVELTFNALTGNVEEEGELDSMNARAFSRRRLRRGMVLFEVVIALGIFATAAFALVLALDSAFDAAADRNRIDMAIRGLSNQAVLLRTSRISPGELDMPDDGTGITYHVTITQEQIKDQKNTYVPNMYRATITAKWTAHAQPDEREFSELIFQP